MLSEGLSCDSAPIHLNSKIKTSQIISPSTTIQPLFYNQNVNTLTKGGASSNLAGDAFFQDNYANNINVEPLTVSAMLWYPGLDGAMYASSQNSAYGVLKVTSNGDGTFTSTKLPDDFKNPARNTVEAVGANGNILTLDFNTGNNYCYINNGGNSYTKTAVGASKAGYIVNSINYAAAQSNKFGMEYMDFAGKSLIDTVVQPSTNLNPNIATPINMNDCSTNNATTNYLVNSDGEFLVSNKFIIVGYTASRVINLNTISDGSDGN